MNSRKYEDMDEVTRRIVYAAYQCVQGVPQTEIAEMSGVAEATIARDIKQAESDKLIKKVFDYSKLSKEVVEMTREKAHHSYWEWLEKALMEQSGNTLKHLRVFYSGSDKKAKADEVTPKTSRDWDEQIDRFAENTAWYIRELLENSKEGIAVGWGKTVATVVDLLSSSSDEEDDKNQKRRKKLDVIPTTGDPIGPASVGLDVSSTIIAGKLSYILNGPGKHVPSLQGVPSVIPETFKNDVELNAVKKFIRHMRSYREIFGDPDNPSRPLPLIEKVDTILTSAGSFHNWNTYVNELISIGGVKEKELRRKAIGDIGGALIPYERVESNKNEKRDFDDISKLWTGIQLSDYDRIAKRAAQRHEPDAPPGVILYALGENKAGIIFDLVVRKKLANVLIVDWQLADGLIGIIQNMKKKAEDSSSKP